MRFATMRRASSPGPSPPHVVPRRRRARAKRMARRIPMHITLSISLLACAMAGSPCSAGAAEPALQTQDAVAVDATVPTAGQAIAPGHSAAAIGTALDPARLAALRGGKDTIDSRVLVDGKVDDNTAFHVVSGDNLISDGAFGSAAGINTVIQNTGSNVLIQNGMVVNVQFVAPVP
jgi:hypothetical protein